MDPIDYGSAEVIGFNPPPGQKSPGKYPQVGPAYNYYGEQPGYTYNWQSDSYIPNRQDSEGILEQAGYGPPKKPGMMDTLGPLAAGAGALGLAHGFAQNPSAVVGGIKDAVTGIGGGIKDAASGLGNIFGFPSAAGGGGGVGAGASTAGAVGAASGAPFSFPGIGAPVAGEASFGGMSVPMATYEGVTAPAAGAAPFSFGPAAGIAAGAATGYLQGKGVMSALKDKKLSFPEQAALALPTFGFSFLSNLFLGKGDDWKKEKGRLENLAEDGVFVPDNLLESMPTKGRKLEDLIDKNQAPDFVGFDASGKWVNNKFAHSRNVKDLVAEDIVNYSAFAENDNEWFKKPLQERLNIANAALQSGAVKEGKGTISVDFEKFDVGAPGAYTAMPGNKTPLGGGAAPQQGGRTRVSPGVWKDEKGEYKSKTGERGK